MQLRIAWIQKLARKFQNSKASSIRQMFFTYMDLGLLVVYESRGF